ncbi:MAG: hypothetical protein WAV83_08775 [Methanothrix sp.]|uniref:hypothetical protein n=1 Tax=Methanothrix sp. TaxID=90426 RepID=UPI003BB1AA48
MSEEGVSPGIWRYGLALAIVIAGFGTFAWYLSSGISGSLAGLTQMAAPGEVELDLDEPGEYIIFYENESYFDGRFYRTAEQIPGLEIAVVEKASGRRLRTYPPAGSLAYSLGGRSGRAIMAFKADEAGIYAINASYPSGHGPQIILAAGKEIMEGMLWMIMISMSIVLGSLLIAAAITYKTYTERKRALERPYQRL